MVSIICLQLFLLTCLLGDITQASDDLQFVKCNYTAYPESGCEEETTVCNKTTEQCSCPEMSPIIWAGRCYSNRDLGDFCLTSLVCARIRGKCTDASGEEVSITDKSEEYYYTRKILPGVCKCPEGQFYNQQIKACQERVLEKKCFFTADCFARSHASCESGKCRCKAAFFHDYLADEVGYKLTINFCLFNPTNNVIFFPVPTKPNHNALPLRIQLG